MKTYPNSIWGMLLLLTLASFACQPTNQTTDTNTPKENLAVAVDSKGPEYLAVEAAILDYVEGIYQVDSTRIERSVHPQLRKRGYWYNKEKATYYDNLDMTYSELVNLAANWNKSGENANADSPKQIDIYDINDRTASAKLTAEWGIDYFHLAKLEDRWMIMNVLWQSIKEEEVD